MCTCIPCAVRAVIEWAEANKHRSVTAACLAASPATLPPCSQTGD